MPVTELKADARKLIMENAPKLFFVSIVYIIITNVMSEFQFRLPGFNAAYNRIMEQLMAWNMPEPGLLYSSFRPGGAVIAGVLWLLQPIIVTGFMSYCMNVRRRVGGDYKDILNGFAYPAKVIMISLVTTILTFLWTMLFIFPGIIASYRYRQAYYILLDDPEKGILQCIRESKRMMHGNKLDLFLIDLSFIGWVLLDVIVVALLPLPFALPVISIWYTPYMGLTHAAFYDRLLGKLIL